MKKLTLGMLALIIGASATVAALYVRMDIQNVPVERVTANLERELADSPRDVRLLVNLARVHAMAFAQKRDTVPTAVAMGTVTQRQISPWLGYGVPDHIQAEVRTINDPQALADAREQLNKAISRYREALAIDPQNLVARLGLGWCLLQAGDRGGAVAALRDVIAQSWPADRKSVRVHAGQRSLTEEAARYLIPLLDDVQDRTEIDELKSRARELEKQPRAITPIAIPLEDHLEAADIEDGDRTVAFDADGSGFQRRWTWIRPNAGWLVFDRHDDRRVTSGLQLFGSVTFWLFWENGYQALRALDDDGDGSLAGRELDGLAVWRDQNVNGMSERGEVRPVAAWGIRALSCLYEYDTQHPDEIAFSPRGVTFANGKVRPTFDLVLHRRIADPVQQR